MRMAANQREVYVGGEDPLANGHVAVSSMLASGSVCGQIAVQIGDPPFARLNVHGSCNHIDNLRIIFDGAPRVRHVRDTIEKHCAKPLFAMS
jgi:hypothetical protein